MEETTAPSALFAERTKLGARRASLIRRGSSAEKRVLRTAICHSRPPRRGQSSFALLSCAGLPTRSMQAATL
eukprot:9341770-Pyramimonas_sp.AAC.1